MSNVGFFLNRIKAIVLLLIFISVNSLATGSSPKIDIEVSTNGEDADSITGPNIEVGAEVIWRYVIKNLSNEPLRDIVVTDNRLGNICNIASLAVSSTKECIKKGTSKVGQYENIGHVTGMYYTYTVEDNDTSHYLGKVKPSYPPVAVNDNQTGVRCQPIIFNILENDSDQDNDLNQSSVNLVDVNGSKCLDSDNDGDIDTLIVPNEGSWNVLNSGLLTYTPSNDCSANPTTIHYTVSDDSGNVSNQASVTVDYPVVKKSTIGDFVWFDKNRDGIQDETELGLPDITVKLFDANNKKIDSTKTNALGQYSFANLLKGEYYLQFSIPTGYTVTLEAKGDDNKNSDVDSSGKTKLFTLNEGEILNSKDMGLYPTLVLLGNKVWYDENKNGIQDSEEKKGIPNINVKLYNKDNILISETKTRTSGLYEFKDLTAGQYYVLFEIPQKYKGTLQDVGTNDSADSDGNSLTGKTKIITLIAGVDNRTVDMGLYQEAGKVGDRVWYDSNKNGLQDKSENGVGNVLVKLYRVGESKAVAETKTTPTGIYSFEDVRSGEYYIIFTAPVAYTITSATKGNDTSLDSNADKNGRTENFTLLSGTRNSSIDMGIYQNMVSFGDRVWLDANHDGLQNKGETGVKDIKVILHSATNEFSKSTLTDENGNYLFTHLSAGEYSVEFQDMPYGHLITKKDVNENENDLNDSDVFLDVNQKLVTEVTLLTPGKNDLSWDMGIYKTVCLPGKAVLGNLVWEDYNKNGIQDIGESGIANVGVTLFNHDTDTKVATVTTDENGLYEFAHIDPAFAYYIQFSIPSGYVVSPQDQDDDIIDSDADETGKTDVITLSANQIDSSVDMGLHHEGSSIGDRVWFDDKNGVSNGIQDEGENGVLDVLVTLYDTHGETIKTTRTNASGEYHFTNILKGRYILGFSNLPDGYVFTLSEQGDDEERDSDVNSNGRTNIISINGVHNITYVDVGIKLVKLGESANDIKRGVTGNVVTIDVLANDIEGSYNFDATTVRITSNPEGSTLSKDGKKLTVKDEGIWSVNRETGAVTFTPNSNFIGDPTAISYSVQDTQGNETGAEVEINYPPVANNDSVNGEVGRVVTIYVTDNDTATSSPLDKASVRIIDPTNGDEVEMIIVDGEGRWSTNHDGSITFTPIDGFKDNPTAIEYIVREQLGDVSNRATVTILYPDAVDDIVNVPPNHNGAIVVNVTQNDSNNTIPSTVTIGCNKEGVKSLTVKDEGVWSVDENGIVTFTPDVNFTSEPHDIQYTVALLSEERSNCATVDVRYELLARDDVSTLNVGSVSLINILNNDFGSLNPESVILIIPENAPVGSRLSDDNKTLTVPSEGVWHVNIEGVVSFTLTDGLTHAPTPIKYTVENSDGVASNQATITLTQGGIVLIANDDIGVADAGNTIVINVLDNDIGDINSSSVQLLGEDGSHLLTLEVQDEGTWQVNDDGTVSFTGFAGYTGTPTPIRYVVSDNAGELSNSAVITIRGVCVCAPYETSIPAMGKIAAVIMVLLTLLVSSFLFKEDEGIVN